MLSTTNSNEFVGMAPVFDCDDQCTTTTTTTPPMTACYCADCCSSSTASSVQGDTNCEGWFFAPNNSNNDPVSGTTMMDPAYMANAKAGEQPMLCDCCFSGEVAPMTTEEFKPSFYNPFEVKHRRRTSRAQFKVLEKTFQENPKPNAHKRRSLAQKLGMTPRGVQVWFQNRRAKAKAQQRREQQQQETVVVAAAAAAAAAPPMQRQNSNASSSYSEQLTPITPMDMLSFMDHHDSCKTMQPQQEYLIPWDLVPGLAPTYPRMTDATLALSEPDVTLDRVTEADAATTAAAFAALFDPYFDVSRRTSYPTNTMVPAQTHDFSEATRRLSEPIYNNGDLDLSWMTAYNGFA